MNRRFVARLFWLYVACVIVTWSAMIVRYLQGGLITSPNDRHPGVVVLLLVMSAMGFALLFMVIAIGRYVYADAQARGMEPLFWASVAMLVPFFIGLAGYLEARRHVRNVCPACRKEVAGNAAYCEGCGHRLGRTLTGDDALFCPQCGTKIGEIRRRPV